MYVAFQGFRRIACGDRDTVWRAVSSADPAEGPAAVFDAETGFVVDLDPRAAGRESPARVEPRPRGRPKIGVVAREVTLLPRQWDWLASQPGGASAALRRIVDAAKKAGREGEAQRRGREAAYRFMAAVAGDLAGFEEAARSLFAGDDAGLAARTCDWPQDVRSQVAALLAGGSEGA